MINQKQPKSSNEKLIMEIRALILETSMSLKAVKKELDQFVSKPQTIQGE